MVEEANSDLSGRVIGAAIAVHRTLGPGFLESVYELAMAVELDHLCIPYTRQVQVEFGYRGRPVGEGRVDMIVERCLILELKAVDKLIPLHEQQRLSYLKVTDLRLGLLINFNVDVLTRGVRRVVNGYVERADV